MYRIEGILDPGNPDGADTPACGQIVELKKRVLLDDRLPPQVAFEICRPDPAHDNRIWSNGDFERCPLFRSRWSGYDDLETTPLVCHGYLLGLQTGFVDRSCDRFARFTPVFECVVHPVGERA